MPALEKAVSLLYCGLTRPWGAIMLLSHPPRIHFGSSISDLSSCDFMISEDVPFSVCPGQLVWDKTVLQQIGQQQLYGYISCLKRAHCKSGPKCKHTGSLLSSPYSTDLKLQDFSGDSASGRCCTQTGCRDGASGKTYGLTSLKQNSSKKIFDCFSG